MRRPARSKSRRGRVSQTHSAPAPIKGWNARDSITAMAPGYAGLLKNWFPNTTDVQFRKGMATFSTGITDGGAAQVETLIAYRPPTGSHKLWAFAGTKLFDASSAGAVGAATLTGLTNARWQCVNSTTTGGNYLTCVNGVDKLRLYDGAAWTTIDGGSAPAITGVTTSTLINVNLFKERIWFVQSGTLDAWYLPTASIAGAATKFALGSIFKKGGYLMAMGTWTLDGGNGVDDLAVFITSQGEVAVYQGTNPASADTWALVGIYNIGAPLGRRCFSKLAGELLILTTDGVVPASKAFASGRSNKAIAVSDNISGAIGDAASLYKDNFGWECTLYPVGGMILVNVPVATNLQEQYVMNTTTGSWCQFTEWHANTFEVFNDKLYFGMLGEVRQGWSGTSDVGANIVGEMIGAFDYFGDRNGLKHIKLLRPIIGWDSNPSEFLIGVDVDFKITTPTGAIAFAASTGGVWDTGTWDSALWGGDVTLNNNWYSAPGIGFAIAPHLKISSSQADIRIAAFDYAYERGAIL